MIVWFNSSSDKEKYEFVSLLLHEYPLFLREPVRLKNIIDIFKSGPISVVIEEDYVDKQYRDLYYSYYGQKYNEHERNCVRLAFFDAEFSRSSFEYYDSKTLEKHFIGSVVLNPLDTGNIGRTLINPQKCKIKGHCRVTKFHVMILARNLSIWAFPFSTQDRRVMSCAETALYNLISFYCNQYAEYRSIMPGELSKYIEDASYERVIPSEGISEYDAAKVLERAHLFPKLYEYSDHFLDLLCGYSESGIPFLLNLPRHMVICVGHGEFDMTKDCSHLFKGGKSIYYLNISNYCDNYIIMDDNQAPYKMANIATLLKDYIVDDDLSEINSSLPSGEGYSEKAELPDSNLEGFPQDFLQNHLSLIVPLYKRVYLDYNYADYIVRKLFLDECQFVEDLRHMYEDDDWGASPKHPIIYRLFLTSAHNYREHKFQKETTEYLRSHVMNNAFPHFMWVAEIGTLDSFSKGKARAEIVLDASSSHLSEENALLSIRYKNRFVFVPDEYDLIYPIINKPYVVGQDSWAPLDYATQRRCLTTIMNLLYNKERQIMSDDFYIISDYKLERI